MRVTGLSIETEPTVATTMGQPHAFVGGMIDLAPAQAGRVVVARELSLLISLDDGRSIPFTTPVGRTGGVRELFAGLRVAEAYDAIPEGITAALAAYLQEQGLDAEVMAPPAPQHRPP